MSIKRAPFVASFLHARRGRRAARLLRAAVRPVVVEPLENRVLFAVSATLTGALLTDNNGSGTINPGDSVRYTTTVSVTVADATGVNVSIPLDVNTTLVPGSVHLSPLARNDSYTWVGNTVLDSAAAGLPTVFANDAALNVAGTSDTFSLSSPTTVSTTNGGSVTINGTTGAFVYTPPTGFAGSDTFNYTLANSSTPGLTNTGTATITMASRVWYVRNNTTNGNGVSATPFNSLASASTAANAATDVIYVFSDNTGNPTLNAAATLANGVQLLGQGVALTVNAINLFPAITPPTITNTAGNVVTLGQNNTVRGLNIGGNRNGLALTNTGTGTVGNLTIGNVAVLGTGTTAGGVRIANGGALNVALSSLAVTGGSAGVRLEGGVTGTFTATSGSITGTTASPFVVGGSSAGVTFGGSITNSTAANSRVVDVQNQTGGTIALSGAITDTAGSGGGVFLNANAGATINLTGGVTVSTAAGNAFTATGGGTISVTGSGNTIATTTGAALNVSNTTIAATGLTFRSISAGTAAGSAGNGITLDTTGALGGLTVTGLAGIPGTGGTIRNKTGADGSTAGGIGVYLNNTANVSLSLMQLNDFQNYGILGNNVAGFTLNSSTVNGANGNNNALDEDSVHFNNLTGSASIAGCTITNTGGEDALRVSNGSNTTLDRLTVQNCTIAQTSTAGDDAFAFVSTTGSNAVMRLTVDNVTFTAARGDLLNTNALGTTTMDVVVTNSRFSNNNTNILSAGGGVTIAGGAGGNGPTGVNVTFNVSGNTFRDAVGSALNLGQPAGFGTFVGTINANTIGVSGVPMSGSRAGGDGITATFAGSNGTAGTHRVTISNNTITNYGQAGMQIGIVQGNAVLNATVIGNSASQPGSATLGAFAGLWAYSGGAAADTTTLNLLVGDFAVAGRQNNFVDADPSNTTDLFLDRGQFVAPSAVFNLSRAGSPSNTVLGVIQDDNVGSPTVGLGGTPTLVNTTPPQLLTVAPPPSSSQSQSLALLYGPAVSTPALRTQKPAAAAAATRRPAAKPRPAALPSSSLVEVASSPPLNISGQPPVAATIGTLNAGKSVTLVYTVSVDNPAAAGVNNLLAQGAVSGTNFATFQTDDPSVAGTANATSLPLDAAPDLGLTVGDGGVSPQPGGVVSYTLNYANAGNQSATGVFLTETVPANATFNAAASTPGWTVVSGSTYRLNIGPLAGGGGGGSGSAVFAVNVTPTVPLGTSSLSNTASVADDAANGADPTPGNNTATKNTTITLVAPTVSSFRINDGTSNQRSKVTALRVTFDQPVVLDAGAITLVQRNLSGGAGTPVTVTPSSADGGRTFDLGFTPGVGGSLVDGVYDLTVVATKVHSGSPTGPAMAANAALAFHRLFSDSDGDGDSDNADLFQVRSTFNKLPADPAFRPFFDYESNGTVDNADLFQVRARRGIEFKGY